MTGVGRLGAGGSRCGDWVRLDIGLAEVERFHRLADERGPRQAMQQLAADAGPMPEELEADMETLASLESAG